MIIVCFYFYPASAENGHEYIYQDRNFEDPVFPLLSTGLGNETDKLLQLRPASFNETAKTRLVTQTLKSAFTNQTNTPLWTFSCCKPIPNWARTWNP